MTKRKKKTAKQQTSRSASQLHYQQAAESRTAVAATVAWMLALMATVLAELLGLTCQLYTILVENLEVLRVLGTVMLFVALLAGFITLALVPIVLRVAQRRPPRSIVVFSLVVGILPLVALALQQFI